MEYYNLYADFIALFPDDADKFKELSIQADADENDGMHIVFSFIVIPYVLELFKNDDDSKLSKAFSYFEKMASSESADVTEVLEFTIIENLMSNGKSIYDKAKTYMSKNMLECCTRAEQFLQVDE